MYVIGYTLREEHNTSSAGRQPSKRTGSRPSNWPNGVERITTEKQLGESERAAEEHRQQQADLEKCQNNEELKDRLTVLDSALKEATEAREEKAAMRGELKVLKLHSEQLAGLLPGKAESAAVKAKK